MNKYLVWAIVLAFVLIGGYFFLQESEGTPGDLGTYAYTCANGSSFEMAPSADMSTIALTAGSQGMFTGTATLAAVEGLGARYEGEHMGSMMVFVGAGEEVQLSVGAESTICNPIPSSDMAPWNWGDAGEGGGMQQDVALVVTESIQGKWQSIDDAKFVREFKAGDMYIDWYDGAETSAGMWVAFEKGVDAPEVPFPMEENTVYIQMTTTGTPADTLNFKLTKLTPEELELIYMDRGGVLRFTSIE